MPHPEELTQEKAVEIMREQRFVMLSTVLDGKIVSHPMTPMRVEDDASVWFFVGRSGEQGSALQGNTQVNLAFAETGSWLSVAGTAEFVEDAAKARELWDDQLDAYFPQGTDDPDLGLVKVHGESAQYWGVPGPRAAAAAKMLVAKLRGDEGPGISGKTEL
ncbi:pyridoxamine 5'-phosphate oxidase family protein [Brachybacterium subflavum]|uniref:pyridoxamine 5'-phosphate oxidase family protein n=1 Tax=Brachybacterium subflavum TaxID=2585206 RepID=UPI00126644CA|nr:pyridoxamine 5'-phosphate oxidase family protein [Brachybacterium subflavum]